MTSMMTQCSPAFLHHKLHKQNIFELYLVKVPKLEKGQNIEGSYTEPSPTPITTYMIVMAITRFCDGSLHMFLKK